MPDTKQPPPTALDAVVDALAPIWDDCMTALTRDQILALATAIATDAPTRAALAVLVTEAWEVAAMTNEANAAGCGMVYVTPTGKIEMLTHPGFAMIEASAIRLSPFADGVAAHRIGDRDPLPWCPSCRSYCEAAHTCPMFPEASS